MRGCYLQVLLLLLGVLLSCTLIETGFCSDLHYSKLSCLDEERQALLEFKQQLVDRFYWLSSWDVSYEDCCKWKGIQCSNQTGHVVKIDLRGNFAYGESTTKYVEGEISSSLLGLHYLTYLDLSSNNFSKKSFPNFVGSLTKLQYLNLSNTQIVGAIPQQLGNLSGLVSLGLSFNDLTEAHNLDWLIHLSSLTHLDMNWVNLSQVLNWPIKVMMLPSLKYLSLTYCNLISTTTPQLLSINANSSSRLLFLDLSLNDYLNCSVFPWLFNSTTSLVELYLKGCGLQCSIPDAFGSINSLRILDLSKNELAGSIPKSFSNLCALNSLSLSYNELSGNPFEFLSNVSSCLVDSLQDFQIRYNRFTGPLPGSIGNLSGLISLDLGENSDLTEANNLDWLVHLSSLTKLDMSSINLSQVFNWPNKINMLPSLTDLVLFYCNLPIITPQVLSINTNSSSQLQYLDLSENYLNCSIFNWLFNSTTTLVYLGLSGCGLQCPIPKRFSSINSLQILDLYGNQLYGCIPKSLWNLCNLTSLFIDHNNLSGHLYGFMSNVSGCMWDSLREFDISNNRFIGPLPESIGNLSNLVYLDVSENYLAGVISEAHFSSLRSLLQLYMSNNQLHGNLLGLSLSRLADYACIDLSSNIFNGSIPPFPSNVARLDLSNNRFFGNISFLCKFRTTSVLKLLNLANNTLSGELPDCWTYFPNLVVLNLANNNFYGEIPNSMGSLASLFILHLNNNGIVGKIPMSLQNCSMLKTIDLGTNNLFGMVPAWLGDSLPNLVVLSIRSNRFNGGLPLNLCRLSHIQILDLSSNQIEGTIPECIYNLTAMSDNQYGRNMYLTYYGTYGDHASLVWKGREFVFQKASLGLVKMIDLSNNKLHGVVPEGITNLTELLALNLSRNNLTGLIPTRIGLLRNLQSLDFSRNQLYGEIPISMSNISFLSQLDLSNNNFSGKIPTGTQIQSFNASAFMGNSKLCGSPLPNKCLEDLINTQGDKKKNVRANDDDGFITEGFYIAATLGFIGGFWGVCIFSVLNMQYIMKRLTSNAQMILA